MEDFDFIDIENDADDAEVIAEAQKATYAELDAQYALDAFNAANNYEMEWAGNEPPF